MIEGLARNNKPGRGQKPSADAPLRPAMGVARAIAARPWWSWPCVGECRGSDHRRYGEVVTRAGKVWAVGTARGAVPAEKWVGDAHDGFFGTLRRGGVRNSSS